MLAWRRALQGKADARNNCCDQKPRRRVSRESKASRASANKTFASEVASQNLGKEGLARRNVARASERSLGFGRSQRRRSAETLALDGRDPAEKSSLAQTLARQRRARDKSGEVSVLREGLRRKKIFR